MTLIEAAKQALEALGWTDEWRPQGLKEKAIDALRTAIAAQPAPVQVSPADFVDMVMDKEDAIGKPILWAEWPNREKNNAA